MGELFVDGSLALQEVEENRELLQSAQAEALAFIQEMGGWPFYKALCVITQDSALLTPLEQRIREEIVHPSFCKPQPKGTMQLLWYKLQRIWFARWKHPLVFKEWWFPALITKVWCCMRRERIDSKYSFNDGIKFKRSLAHDQKGCFPEHLEKQAI